MQIRLKLYASLGSYLPENAIRNEIDHEVEEGTSVVDVFNKLKLPGELCHLVMINGTYLSPGEREKHQLAAGDALAVWPPVAGG